MRPPTSCLSRLQGPLWAALAVLLAVVVRLGLWRALPLGDTPGPGGALFLTRALQDRPQPEPYVGLLRLAWALVGDVVQAGWTLALLGSLGVVLGAGAAARALGPRGAGPMAMAMASVWALSVQPALQVGPDAPALGLAALGVGVAWALTARAPGLGAALGVLLVGAATALKAVAAPALGLVALGVLLAGRRAVAALLGLAVGAGLLAAVGASPWEALPGGAAPAWVDWPGAGGLEAVQALADRGWTTGVVRQVFAAALLAGAVPQPGGRRRVVAALGVAALALIVADMGAARLRPRYLLSVGVGALAVLGAGVAALPHRGLRAGVAAIALALLGLDLWAWSEALGRVRAQAGVAPPASLPAAPAPWARRHATLSPLAVLDTSVLGAQALGEAVEDATVGVAVVPLRDSRHLHALLLAHQRRRAAVVLDPRACCAGPTDSACAARVAREVEAAGLTLLVPRGGANRVDAPLRPWVEALEAATSGQETAWWRTTAPLGEGASLPCGLSSPRRRPGPPLVVDARPR